MVAISSSLNLTWLQIKDTSSHVLHMSDQAYIYFDYHPYVRTMYVWDIKKMHQNY